MNGDEAARETGVMPYDPKDGPPAVIGPEPELAAQGQREGALMPVCSPEEMSEALLAYRGLQTALDKRMPDQIMTIAGRRFRKKGYWRAVRLGFNLSVFAVAEKSYGEKRLILNPEADGDWGYNATYRAVAGGGKSADGDGSCAASEKIVYEVRWEGKKKITILDSAGRPKADRFKTMKNQTEHNVRSHAHTRAFNRAVSNLVGFGEVSAEEMPYSASPETPAAAPTAGMPLPAEVPGTGEAPLPACKECGAPMKLNDSDNPKAPYAKCSKSLYRGGEETGCPGVIWKKSASKAGPKPLSADDERKEITRMVGAANPELIEKYQGGKMTDDEFRARRDELLTEYLGDQLNGEDFKARSPEHRKFALAYLRSMKQFTDQTPF